MRRCHNRKSYMLKRNNLVSTSNEEKCLMKERNLCTQAPAVAHELTAHCYFFLLSCNVSVYQTFMREVKCKICCFTCVSETQHGSERAQRPLSMNHSTARCGGRAQPALQVRSQSSVQDQAHKCVEVCPVAAAVPTCMSGEEIYQ